MLIYGMHGKPPPGSIQKLYRFENPRNELIVACLSGPAYERKMAADSRDLGNYPAAHSQFPTSPYELSRWRLPSTLVL